MRRLLSRKGVGLLLVLVGAALLLFSMGDRGSEPPSQSTPPTQEVDEELRGADAVNTDSLSVDEQRELEYEQRLEAAERERREEIRRFIEEVPSLKGSE